MLHAFNQKQARRIFQARDSEHRPEKSEDAATSMVFSPLAFMQAADALECLVTVLGAPALDKVSGREPVSHEVVFWPQGRALSSTGEGLTRCEPDLIIRFTFTDGSELLFVGEMKWNWHMEPSALAEEVRRERSAMRRLYPGVPQMAFVVAKRGYNGIPKATALTWKQFNSRLAPLAGRLSQSPSTVWASLIRGFLSAADEWGFSGIPSSPRQTAWDVRPAFHHIPSASGGWPVTHIDPSWSARPAFWIAK